MGITDEVAAKFIKLGFDEHLAPIKRMLELYPGLESFNPACALYCANLPYVEDWLKTADADAKLEPGGHAPIEYVAYSQIARIKPERLDAMELIAKILLEHGADANTSHKHGDWDLPVLYGAADHSAHPGITRLLLQAGANPNDGESVYHAAQHNRPQILEVLLEHGADLSHRVPPTNNTPLYFNAGHRPSDPGFHQAYEGIRWLLEHGADPNLTSYNVQETPLHVACRTGAGRKQIELYLKHGADKDKKRADGRSPYALAIISGNTEAAQALVDHGASTSLTEEDQKLREGLESGSMVSGWHLGKLAEHGRLEELKRALDGGSDVGAKGDHGASALHWACFAGRPEVVDLLLKYNPPLDQEDDTFHGSPLGWAIHGWFFNAHDKTPYPRIVESLLKAGAPREPIQQGLNSHDAAPADLDELRRVADAWLTASQKLV